MEPLFNWLKERQAGVLLHPTCLPGDQGIGTLDGSADRFLEFLEAAGAGLWQICPLGPTGYGDSPYQCLSALAGNPYLVDMNDLAGRGLLKSEEVAPLKKLGRDRVDFGAVYQLKAPLFAKAYTRYKEAGEPALGAEGFGEFKERHAGWLDDYAYFRALKDRNEGKCWMEWPMELRDYETAKNSKLRGKLEGACEAQRFAQYLFFVQWRRVRELAAKKGISVIGDIPIFVAGDSADVWSHPDLFELDEKTKQPLGVAGVPPDYFSADGQLWGNPLYLWKRHAEEGYRWWLERLKSSFELYDMIRVDHFRGFESYWRVPYPAENARVGKWTPGPGLELFRAIAKAWPQAKILAEDLGLITPEVAALREESGCPGMAVLQFAFGGKADNPYLPHNLTANQVIYPGTHDNDTTRGWYAGLPEAPRDHVRRYLRVDGKDIGWDFIRAAYESVSRLAIVPMGDILSLGSEGRLNTPGKPDGNWQWRCQEKQLEGLFGQTAGYLSGLGELYGRV